MFADQQSVFCLVHLPMANKEQWGEVERQRFLQAIDWATAKAAETRAPLNLTGLQLPDNIPLKLNPRFGLIMSGSPSTIRCSQLFADTIFDGDVILSDVQFPVNTNFRGSEFSGSAQIHINAHGKAVYFEGCIFRGDARLYPIRADVIRLDGAQFQGTATLTIEGTKNISLERARFHKEMSANLTAAHDINLDNIECRSVARLDLHASRRDSVTTIRNARFLEGVSFGSSALEGELILGKTQVEKSTRFDRVSFGPTSTFEKCIFNGEAWFIGSEADIPGTGNCFHAVSFAGAEFRDRAVFINRHLKAAADFRHCTFARAPEFHGADIHQAVQFPDESAFSDTTSENAAASYRTLKLAMEQNRARHEEAMFFALEQKSLRNTSTQITRLDWFASWTYETVARYGQSYARPLAGLGISWFVFSAAYAILMTGPLDVCALTWAVVGRAMMISLEQIVNPFWIWRKTQVEIEDVVGIHTDSVKLLATLESVISVAFVALVILGLRWRFKRE
jgi:uncharacterized protein YjbI with pentapeptide repeats